MANPEGPVTPLVTDAMKFQCTNCNGSKFYISTTIDDPADVAQETVFTALLLTYASGTSAQGLIVSCVQCGEQQVPYWAIYDVGASDGAAVTMTNLVQLTSANLLVDHYLVYLGTDANDKGKYFTIASNTAADPTVITPDGTLHADSDGMYMVTNILPVGFTLAT